MASDADRDVNHAKFDPWQFADGDDITIVCAQLPDGIRGQLPYADPADPDYVRLYDYADLDSLIELFGYVRATNPDAFVRFKLAPQLVEDDYTSHLVLLGGIDCSHPSSTPTASGHCGPTWHSSSADPARSTDAARSPSATAHTARARTERCGR